MKKEEVDKEYKKTQSTSSPGAMGEDVNRGERKSDDPITKQSDQPANQEGLNEVRSQGDAGAFEGLEDASK